MENKMSKKSLFVVAVISLLFISCLFFMPACSIVGKKSSVSVESVEKTLTSGLTDTYTVTLSNGETFSFEVTNGRNGKDGTDGSVIISVEELEKFCTKYGLDIKDLVGQAIIPTSTEKASDKAIKSAVGILAEIPTYSYGKTVGRSFGAGIIYKMEDEFSYIMTNYHVVYNSNCNTATGIARTIHAFQYGYVGDVKSQIGYDQYGYPTYDYTDGAIECSYVGGSMYHDIAILKVKTSDLKSYNSQACQVELSNGFGYGEDCIAVGNPEGEGTSITKGIISVENEEITMKGADNNSYLTFRVLRTDAAINGGNSGGGLFNLAGELVGIINAKITDDDGIAYALPVDNVTKVADNLIFNYLETNKISSIKVLNFGVSYSLDTELYTVVDATTGKTKTYDFFIVTSVTEDSVAQRIGVKPGDIIKSATINGKVFKINRYYEFVDLMLTIRKNDTIKVDVERENLNISLNNYTVTENDLVSL